MKPLRDRIEDRVRETICRACIYETAGGGCSLRGMECPIIGRIDRVIEIVRTTHSDCIDPYVERVREVVCSQCQMQNEQGRCALREHADCALDDYLLLLIDLVEQELAKEPA
jgi:hypothetical protein